MRKAGIEAEPEMVVVDSLEEARRHRFLGSPTVKIDGLDVEPSVRRREDFGLG